jgi:hypothetical protein
MALPEVVSPQEELKAVLFRKPLLATSSPDIQWRQHGGVSWHHFHDRLTVEDHAVIRVMSFSRSDPECWTGQSPH